jgi:predicted DNA-binding transcriptional regulator AlpA
MSPIYLSQPDVCRALGISKATMYRWINQGFFFPPTRIGGRALWYRPKFEAWIADNEAVVEN